MTKAVIIGHYVPGKSFLHRLDARTKLLGTVLYTTILFVAVTWREELLLGAFALFALMLGRLPPRAIWRGLRPVLGLVVFTVVLNAVLTPGRPLWQLGPVALSREGTDFGARMGVRLTLLVVMGSLLTLVTAPIDLTDGVEALLRPFSRLGVPAHELALMMTIALRFIPTLFDESERIARAQMARGADLEGGSLGRRLRALASLLVPLLLSAFRRADELAVAMEARCYRGAQGRTRYHARRFAWCDAVAATVTVGLAVAVGWLRWRGR